MKKLLAATLIVATALWLLRRPADSTAVPEPIDSATFESIAAASPRDHQPAPPVAAASEPVAVPTTSPIDFPVTPEPRVHPPIVLQEALIGKNTYYDEEFGVLLVCPEDWSVVGAHRWGKNNRETTVRLQPPAGSRARPRLYYQPYNDAHVGRENPEAYLRGLADTKEASRRAAGAPEYQNDPGSLVYREFAGRPSLSYFATYVYNDEVQAEYFMRVLGPDGYVMFFMTGPVEDVQAQIPAIFEMGSDIVPPGAPLPPG